MSMTAFLRRLSVETGFSTPSSPTSDRKDSTPPLSRGSISARESRSVIGGKNGRRSRLVQSIDSARRRFSLQHNGGIVNENGGSITEKIKRRRELGSLPDLLEVRFTWGKHLSFVEYIRNFIIVGKM